MIRSKGLRPSRWAEATDKPMHPSHRFPTVVEPCEAQSSQRSATSMSTRAWTPSAHGAATQSSCTATAKQECACSANANASASSPWSKGPTADLEVASEPVGTLTPGRQGRRVPGTIRPGQRPGNSTPGRTTSEKIPGKDASYRPNRQGAGLDRRLAVRCRLSVPSARVTFNSCRAGQRLGGRFCRHARVRRPRRLFPLNEQTRRSCA